MTEEEFNKLPKLIKEELYKKFRSEVIEMRMTCANACSCYDTEDKDCYIYGESRPTYPKCPFRFTKWLSNIE